MKPWELLDEATLPEGEGSLELWRRGDEYVIRVDGRDLMSSREHGSERALAELSCARLKVQDPRVLVGGLGMGFTVAAALERLGERATVVVAELVPAVVTWNRGALAHLAAAPLDDPRVDVHEGDVRALIENARGAWNAILLDVDNGPDGLTRSENNWLYEPAGLRASFGALAAGGVIGVWSAFDDPTFTKRLRNVGFEVEVEPVRARGKKGRRHTIWLATRP